MSNFLAAIYWRASDGIYQLLSAPEIADSHTDLEVHFNLKDTSEDPAYVKVEFIPPNDVSEIANLEKWTFVLGKQRGASWWDEDRKTDCLAALKALVKYHIREDGGVITDSWAIALKGKYQAKGKSRIWAYRTSRVVARDKSHVLALDKSHVESWDSSHVEPRDNSNVIARDNSHVVAWDKSNVIAWDKSHVESWDNAHVVARGSSRVSARDNSRVSAWGSSLMQISNNVPHRRGKPENVTLHENAILVDFSQTPTRIYGDCELATN